MKYERGDVVEAGDPFNEEKTSRPFVILNTDAHPFDGEQYVAVTFTTQTWYDETIPVTNDDFLEGGLPKQSFLVPWGVVSLPHSDIREWFGRIDSGPLDETVDQLVTYLRA
ncbi:type II toxin-antitoxin system PemK/MazF family toxin [Natronolimnobius sp. AArcel1]|uniref:type II toxin-antitoxin system PemK/MazF family toxin n=1 Tax=Natronolimnobius sp. AArcel1 TaxID=1679093 RepID=UPI0013ECFD57|nr:type II toxin-antitoxin system PemK/MazF family toxin [Natronolimnobius sp. AArcel1]NGM70292.1 type II toxin-antitoxin system PemK/MazF family toxin [Natronolimnobius sp. AArcel1]